MLNLALSASTKLYYAMLLVAYCVIKADFHSVQCNERAEICDHFLLKCVQSTMSNEISFYLTTHISKESDRTKSCAR